MLVGDKSIPEMHLSQTGFSLIPFESFEYRKAKIKYINLKEEDICMMHEHHGNKMLYNKSAQHLFYVKGSNDIIDVVEINKNVNFIKFLQF